MFFFFKKNKKNKKVNNLSIIMYLDGKISFLRNEITYRQCEYFIYVCRPDCVETEFYKIILLPLEIFYKSSHLRSIQLMKVKLI